MVESTKSKINGFCEECGAILIEVGHETTCSKCGLVHNDVAFKEERIETNKYARATANSHSQFRAVPLQQFAPKLRTTLGYASEQRALKNKRLLYHQRIANFSDDRRDLFVSNLLVQLRVLLDLSENAYENARYFANKILNNESFKKKEKAALYIVATSVNYANRLDSYSKQHTPYAILDAIRSLGHRATSSTYYTYYTKYDKYFDAEKALKSASNFHIVLEKTITKIFNLPGPHQSLDKLALFKTCAHLLSLLKKLPCSEFKLSILSAAVIYLSAADYISSPTIQRATGLSPSTITQYAYRLTMELMLRLKLFSQFRKEIIKQIKVRLRD